MLHYTLLYFLYYKLFFKLDIKKSDMYQSGHSSATSIKIVYVHKQCRYYKVPCKNVLVISLQNDASLCARHADDVKEVEPIPPINRPQDLQEQVIFLEGWENGLVLQGLKVIVEWQLIVALEITSFQDTDIQISTESASS